MLESKLWYNKTDIKNVKGAKMVEFIKTCDYYPCKFNFGRFFMSIILSFFCWQKIGFPGLLFAGSGEECGCEFFSGTWIDSIFDSECIFQ